MLMSFNEIETVHTFETMDLKWEAVFDRAHRTAGQYMYAK